MYKPNSAQNIMFIHFNKDDKKIDSIEYKDKDEIKLYVMKEDSLYE